MGSMNNIAEIKRLIKDIEPHLGLNNTRLINYNLIFNPCVTDSYLKELELAYDVKLPEEYREYLINIGNGGNQPADGMFTVGQSLSILLGQDCKENKIDYKDLTKYYFDVNRIGYDNLLDFYYGSFGKDLGKKSIETESGLTTLDDYFSDDGLFRYQHLLSDNEAAFVEHESAMKSHMLVFSFEDETRTQFAIALDGDHKDQVVYYSFQPSSFCLSDRNIVFTGMSFLEWMQHLYECYCDPVSVKNQ